MGAENPKTNYPPWYGKLWNVSANLDYLGLRYMIERGEITLSDLYSDKGKKAIDSINPDFKILLYLIFDKGHEINNLLPEHFRRPRYGRRRGLWGFLYEILIYDGISLLDALDNWEIKDYGHTREEILGHYRLQLTREINFATPLNHEITIVLDYMDIKRGTTNFLERKKYKTVAPKDKNISSSAFVSSSNNSESGVARFKCECVIL